jgi:hypothetical protein
VLYRTFPLIPGSGPADLGGPLHVPRPYQGQGRHDNPQAYGALYASRTPEAAVAEFLRDFQRVPLEEGDFLREGAPRAMAVLDDAGLARILDLDDPRTLVRRDLRPSTVATRDRRSTRPTALAIFRDGYEGFEWWSTIEASWINVTLFADRAIDGLRIIGTPDVLTTSHPAVQAAAEVVGVTILP